MRTTRSHANIEKAMELNKLIRAAQKLAKKIKPLKAHFRPLLDDADGVLVAGRLAVVGNKKTRTSVNREKLAPMITSEQMEEILDDVSYIEIDVKPVIELVRGQKSNAANA